ncbi:MAG TPA: flavodoxin domain-containing protein, partial [Beijerinckiaceae bacterium]|nr:flavodoxin domain-containing protein [Beijerinckiaceae bacterium]
MATTALLPRTAPFLDDQIASLDRVLSVATPVQRAWLAGFLAGIDAAAQPAPAQAQPRAAEPITIVFASESGNAERIAQDAAKLARKSGFRPKVIDFADLELAALKDAGALIVVAATWGEGEPPSRAARAYAELISPEAPRLEGVKFGVLALGDTAYAEFCAVGKALDARLAELGATRVVDRIDCDLDFDSPASAWVKRAIETLVPAAASDNVVAVDFGGRGSAEVSREHVLAEVLEHVNLNSSRSDKETFHLALGFEQGAPGYEPGDALELFAENDPALVDAVLSATGLAGDDSLREALTKERDITTLSVPVIQKFADATSHAGVRALLDGDVRAWKNDRQLIDLLETFPASLDRDQLLALTRPLPTRAYSIASSRAEAGDEAHLLIAAV